MLKPVLLDLLILVNLAPVDLVQSVLCGLCRNKRGRDVEIKSSDDKRTVFQDELVNDFFIILSNRPLCYLLTFP